MPITSLAACLPFAAIGTAVLQISISARDTQFPRKMPDIRLQANSRPPIIDQSLLAGGVHIRLVRWFRSEMSCNPLSAKQHIPGKTIEKRQYDENNHSFYLH